MGMLGAIARVLGWFARFRPRPVELSCPYPPEECVRRLAAVTSQRGYRWFLSSENDGRPDPRLRGDIDAVGILVARFEDSLGTNSFTPWLDVRAQPAAGGGTVLAGRIGLHPDVKVFLPVLCGAGALIPLVGLVAGVSTLISGHFGRALPFLLIPLALGAFMVGFNVAGLRSLERKIPELIREMNRILGSAPDDADV